MAEQFEVIYKNKQSGKVERCTMSQWEKIKAHPTLGRAFSLIKTEVLPQAAVEAQQAKEDQENTEQASVKSESKPKKSRKK